MVAKFLCMSERIETANFKSGPKEFALVTLLDMTAPRMLNTVDLELSAEDKATHAGKLTDKTVEVGLTDMATAFGGRLRCKGRILSVK